MEVINWISHIGIGDWVYLTKRIQEYQKNPIDMCKDAPSQPFKTKVRNIVHTKSGKTLYQVNSCHFSDDDIGVSVFKNYDDARDVIKLKRNIRRYSQ